MLMTVSAVLIIFTSWVIIFYLLLKSGAIFDDEE